MTRTSKIIVFLFISAFLFQSIPAYCFTLNCPMKKMAKASCCHSIKGTVNKSYVRASCCNPQEHELNRVIFISKNENTGQILSSPFLASLIEPNFFADHHVGFMPNPDLKPGSRSSQKTVLRI